MLGKIFPYFHLFIKKKLKSPKYILMGLLMKIIKKNIKIASTHWKFFALFVSVGKYYNYNNYNNENYVELWVFVCWTMDFLLFKQFLRNKR